MTVSGAMHRPGTLSPVHPNVIDLSRCVEKRAPARRERQGTLSPAPRPKAIGPLETETLFSVRRLTLMTLPPVLPKRAGGPLETDWLGLRAFRSPPSLNLTP